MKAMILAAGFGTRMRPLTNDLPKPMLSVGGKPLIVWHLERLQQNGFKEVVINIAWLGYKIPEILGNGEQFGLSIEYSDEQGESPLETAGGIIKAIDVFRKEPFLVISGDIWCDYQPTLSSPLKGNDLGHLVLVENPPHVPDGNFALEAGRVNASGMSKLTYSGIAYFHPDLFNSLPYGHLALRSVFNDGIEKGVISGERHSGAWRDIGTPERLYELDQLLRQSNSQA